MPTEVLNQLHALREGIAETLRKDPRYLTLAALDRSITEITGVLSASGLTPAAPPAPTALHFDAPPAPGTPAAIAEPVAAPSTAEAAAHAPAAHPAAAAPASAVAAPPLVKKKKKSLLRPLAEAAAVIAAGGLAAEAMHAEAKGTMGEAHPTPETVDAPTKDEPADPDDEEEPAGSEPEAHAEHEADTDDDAADDDTADEAEDEAEDAKDDETDDETDHPTTAADAPEEAEDKADDEASDAEDEAPDAAEALVASGAHEAPDSEAEHATQDKAEAPSEDDVDASDEHSAEPGDHVAAADGAVAEAGVPPGKASGYVPMGAKPGAAQYQPSISVKFGKLPNKVDLRTLMTPVEDQGDTNSCVANAVAGAYEYWIKKASKQTQEISRLFVYYNARWRDGSQDKDAGSVIQLAMEGLAKFGACNEKVWPFDPHLVLKKPGADAYKDAAAYRVHDMQQVPLKIEAWKQALAEGKPIVFGIALFDSFDECSKRGGVVPMPTPDDVARKSHSGHSMCAVGYSDTEKVFIIRNSWGTDWGDKGYCYMPYSYLMSPTFNDSDCWVFVPKIPSQPPREVWSDNTDPVTNSGQGVDFPIETYTVADYANIAVDLFEKVRVPFTATVLEDYSEYVSIAGKGLWSEMEQFDVKTFLASTAALAGVSALATEAFSSETEVSSSSESLSVSSEDSSESEQDATDDADADDDDADDAAEDADDADADDDAQDGDDADSDDDADKAEDAADDAVSDEDGDADDDSDEDAADGDDDDKSDDDDADDDTSDDASDDGEAEDGDDTESDDASDGESEDGDDDDASDDEESEDDSDDDEADDDESDDDGGEDDAGDDDE